MSVADTNQLLGLASIATQLVTVALLLVFLMRKRQPFRDIFASVANYALWSAFFMSFGAAAINVYYSDILGVEACYWCWWQRIFLYPQAVLFAMALWKDKYVNTAVDASLIMSVAGAGIALYHHALQMLPGSGLPCPAVGVSCSQRILFEFGYITYPLMAFSLFAFLIVTMLIARSRRTA
jgi:disulfide bond formation protein DsbB